MLDKTFAFGAGALAIVIVSMVAAFWSFARLSAEYDAKLSSECVQAGGSVVIISGSTNCLRLSDPKQAAR